MNININYYLILEINHNSNKSEIKKSYYNLSKIHHPDIGGNDEKFELLAEAYSILSNDSKKTEYDLKSKYGKNYDESTELLNIEFNNTSQFYNKEKYDNFKKEEGLNIVISVDNTFNGTIEYSRYIICKSCDGTGKDLSSKIKIKDLDPNSPTYGKVKYFEGDDGCDFCEGTGLSYNGLPCGFCTGKGKVGINNCKSCNGEKRIFGKQKILNVQIPENLTNEYFILPSKGNFSKDDINRVGDLYVKVLNNN